MLQIVHKFRELAVHSRCHIGSPWQWETRCSCESKNLTPLCDKVLSKCPRQARRQGDAASSSSGVTSGCCLIDETQQRLTKSAGGGGGYLLSMVADSDTGYPGLSIFNEPGPKRPRWQEQHWVDGLNRLTSDTRVQQRTGLGSDTEQTFNTLQLMQIKGPQLHLSGLPHSHMRAYSMRRSEQRYNQMVVARLWVSVKFI